MLCALENLIISLITYSALYCWVSAMMNLISTDLI